MTSLYKYREFGVNSLRMLCESEVYYSDPSKFNDPLDCSPTLIVDVELDIIEALCHRMVKNKAGKQVADQNINNHRYLSSEYGDYKTDEDVRDYYLRMLAGEVKRQLDLIMKNKGVLSLAGQWDSPLMWSHYADEHKGICIEYDINTSVCGLPGKVDYEGGRGILISSLINWIYNDSVSAKNEIEHKYYFTKASQWKYEEEWRYVNKTQGRQSTPFEIVGIHFGIRCELSVISSVVKLMNGSKSDLKFYRTQACPESFKLLRSELDIHELEACTPRPSAALVFRNLPKI